MDHSAAPPDRLQFAPFAQLVKMLVPSTGTISIYGAANELLWCSDGCERPDLRELVNAREVSAGAAEPGEIRRTSSGAQAFLTVLTDAAGRPIGHLVVELADTSASARRSMIASMLRPVVDALQSRLALEQGPPAGGRRESDGIDVLLDGAGDGIAVLERFLDNAVGSMPAAIAALVVPDAGIELVAKRPAFSAAAASELVEATRGQLLRALETAGRSSVTNRKTAVPGTGRELKLLACALRDTRGRLQGFLAVYREPAEDDFDARDAALLEYAGRKTAMRLNHEHDALTGLYTWAAFERKAETVVEAAQRRDHAVLYVDVDHLHQVNDAFGFDCGDRVLAFVAGRLRGQLEPDQLVGRIGGDRFAVLLPDAEPGAGEALAQRVQAALAEHDYVHHDETIPVTVTIGVAAEAGRAVRHLVADAELASKRAKQRGPGRIAVSRRRPAQDASASAEQLVYRRFEDALADNALALEAQPIVELDGDSSRPVGFEMLVRMRNAAGEWLSAHRFLKAAEQHGMLPAIDRWVIAAALELLEDHVERLEDLPLGVCVNVSTQSLLDGGYARYVLDALSRTRLPAGLVGFEIKEAAAWRHIADADRLIRTLSAAGMRVALDGFGAGSSAIAELRALPIAHAKIDGALLRRCLDDADAAGLVEGLTHAACGLGIATVAEQVESDAVAAVLERLGIDYAQGYLFGSPAPLKDWLERLGAAPQAAIAR